MIIFMDLLPYKKTCKMIARNTYSEAELLDVIRTKVLGVFLIVFHNHLY